MKRTYIIADADHDLTLAQVSGVRVLKEARKIADELRTVVTVRDSLTDRLIATVSPKLLVCLLCAFWLAGCAQDKPQLVEAPKQTAADALAIEQGQLLAKYDAALARAEVIMQRSNRIIAASTKDKSSANTPDQFTADPLAALARSAARGE
jgi:hypothetical protein